MGGLPGRATELTRYILCLPFEQRLTRDARGWTVDNTAAAPLRGIARRYRGGDLRDPSQVEVLTCGHEQF